MRRPQYCPYPTFLTTRPSNRHHCRCNRALVPCEAPPHGRTHFYTRALSHTRTFTHTHARTHTHTHAHTRTHALARTRTHARTHAHTLPRAQAHTEWARLSPVACRLSPAPRSAFAGPPQHPAALQVQVEGLMDGHDLVVQVGSRAAAHRRRRVRRVSRRVLRRCMLWRCMWRVTALHVACCSVACGVL